MFDNHSKMVYFESKCAVCALSCQRLKQPQWHSVRLTKTAFQILDNSSLASQSTLGKNQIPSEETLSQCNGIGIDMLESVTENSTFSKGIAEAKLSSSSGQ